MARAKNKTSRQVALEVLDSFDITRHDAGEILHTIIHQTDQRAHATDLVFGVIRNLPAIDMLTDKLGGTKTERIHKKLVNIIRIGAYELIFKPKTPAYAVINEAANLAAAAGKRQTGFVNAILRNLTRSIADRNISLADADPLKTLPQSSQTGCLFKDVILPDPKTKAPEYLSRAFSLPLWLVTDWLDEFGFEQTRQICFASNRAPGVFVRPNTLKISAPALAQKFTADGIDFDLCESESVLKLNSHLPVTILPGFDEGLFTVQDPAAARTVEILAPQPGWIVLDLCAAPGTKTVQTAQMMKNTGRIIATDIDPQRLKKVEQNCKRLGITIVDVITYEKLQQTIDETERLDAVLLDVPCSNTGVLARRPEVRLRINRRIPTTLAQTQLKILQKAANLFSPGTCGRASLKHPKICYSTCSILNQENSKVVKQFLSTNTNFRLDSELLTLPSTAAGESFDHDGAYTAILMKI